MSGRTILISILFVGAARATMCPAAAQQKMPDIVAGFSAGVAFPTDGQFREFYGSAQFVMAGQVDFRVYDRFFFFSGYGYRNRAGHAEGSNDPLQFRMHTLKLGGLYAIPFGSVLIKAGAGIGVSSYEETWEAAGVATSGTKPGILVQAGIERRIFGRISLGGRVEYSQVTANEINLGGLDLAAGLFLRLK